jgi:DNA-binding CsgD family transcriptional regulator
VRGHLCQLQCRRDGDQALVTIQPLSRRACTKVHHLTTLERQILSLLADGATVDELATSMGLSGGTIRVHLDHIQRRLRLRPEPDGDEQERRHVRLRVLQELKDNHFRR